MKTCDTCGNEIPGEARKCPFCGAHQGGRVVPRTAGRPVITVNLKEGLPRVHQAIVKLDRELKRARSGGAKVVRVIHGYGSSGTGGSIKEAVLKRLASLHARRGIRGFVPGDRYSNSTGGGKALLRKIPSLETDLRTDRNNPGITLVEL